MKQIKQSKKMLWNRRKLWNFLNYLQKHKTGITFELSDEDRDMSLENAKRLMERKYGPEVASKALVHALEFENVFGSSTQTRR
jgi:hypothetical protein